MQAPGVEVDHDGALASAVDVGDDDSRHGGELRTDEVEAVVVQLLLGEALAGETELQDGDAGGGEVDDLRRKDAGRELAEFELGGRGDLRVGGVERGARLEIDLEDGLAVERGGLDVLDVVDEGGEGLLVGRGEAAFEFFWREACVLPGDGDDGDVDVGKDVGGGAEDEDRRSDQDEDR